MSVRTEADELVDKANAGLDQAAQALRLLAIGDVWGWEDYSMSYQSKVRDTFYELNKLRERLKSIL